jgi:CRP-like cAMP-binding protein
VSGEALLRVIDIDPRLARAMLAGLSLRLYELIDDVEAYTTRTAAQRLVGYLLHLSGSGLIAHLPTSKHVVASLLNLTPETLSRILHSLSEAGLIEVAGRRIVIRDAQGLRACV